MRSLNNSLSKAQILFIYVTYEPSAKGRAEKKDRFYPQRKEGPTYPTPPR